MSLFLFFEDIYQDPILQLKIILSVFFIFLVFIVTRFYLRVYRYPKGPTPLPFIGNLCYLRKLSNPVNLHQTLSKFHLKYGPVFTIWFSHKPFVFIADLKLAKEAFEKPEFNDRGFQNFSKATNKGREDHEGVDMLFSDYNHEFMEQKRLLMSALNKYFTTDLATKVTNHSVKELWNDIIELGLDTPIDMSKYARLLVLMVIARNLFGRRVRYEFNDVDMQEMKPIIKKVRPTVKLMNWLDVLPEWLSKFMLNRLMNRFKCFPEMNEFLNYKFMDYWVTWEDYKCRNITDALIAVRDDEQEKLGICTKSEKESYAYASYHHFNNDSMINILSNLIFVGTQTTSCMVKWMFLLMAKNPDMQSRMRREIKQVVGHDRRPTQDDKDKCHYTMAFIHETLRLHPPAPFGLTHHIKTEVKIGGKRIPGQTTIVNYLHSVHRNPDHWPKPDEFNPDRFLDKSGHLITDNNKLTAFKPFGTGLRSCPGEKLALVDGFLILARLLQLTDKFGLEFACHGELVNIEPDPSLVIFSEPVPYKLVLQKRSQKQK